MPFLVHGCVDAAVTDHNYGLQVLYSKRCFVTARSSQPLLPPAKPSTAVYQMAGSTISTGETTSVGLRGAIGRWAEGVRHTAARAQASVRNASTRTIVGGSLLGLFLLVVAMRLPLVRRR